MIKETKGDFTEANEDILIHPINCFGIMDKDTADLICQKLITKEMYLAYQNLCCEMCDDLLGTVQVENLSDSQLLMFLFMEVVNASNGRVPIYDALDDCLDAVMKRASAKNSTVAVPAYLCCDFGSWEEIYSRLLRLSEMHSVDITIYYKNRDIFLMLEDLHEIQINPISNVLNFEWHGFPTGTSLSEISHWFEESFNINVNDYLLI